MEARVLLGETRTAIASPPTQVGGGLNGEPVHPVVDFCAVPSGAVGIGGRGARERLMLFAPTGLERLEAGETIVSAGNGQAAPTHVLSQVGAARRAFDVFLKTFPLRRFRTVIVPSPVSPSTSGGQVDAASLRKQLATLRNARFLTYSLDCTDWLAFPAVSDVAATWRRGRNSQVVVDPTTGASRTVEVDGWSLTLKTTMSLSVFHRVAGGFRLVDTVDARGGGVLDLALDIGSGTMSIAQKGIDAGIGKTLERFDDPFRALAGPGEALAKVLARAMPLVEQAAELERKLSGLQGRLGSIEPELRLHPDAWTRQLISEAAAVATERVGLDAMLDSFAAELDQVEAQLRPVLRAVQNPAAFAEEVAVAANGGWDAIASAWPDSESCIPSTGRDGVPGLGASCLTGTYAGLPSRELGVAGLDQRRSRECSEVRADDMASVASCEVGVRMETVTLLLQKAARGIDGWRLTAPLLAAPDGAPAVALGQAAGLRKGDVFVALGRGADGTREELGFARVTTPATGDGLGGSPSILRWRGGSAPPGTVMVEHPQIGVGVEAAAAVSAFNSTSALSLPVLAGASVLVGYNLSPYVDVFHEFWIRTHLDFLFMSTAVPSVRLGDASPRSLVFVMTAFAGPELKLHLARRLDFFTTVAGGLTVAMITSLERSDDSASGLTGGLLLGGGFDLLLTADFALRIGLEYRLNLAEIRLENADHPDNDYEGLNIGTLSGFAPTLGVGFVF